MSDVVIRVEGLSKLYQLGARQQGYKTFRDRLSDMSAVPYRALKSAFRGSENTPKKEDNTIWAMRDISFEVRRGEIVGVIGRNGAGKSTLLKVLSRITEPTEGYAEIRGRVGSMLEVGTGFHPELTGRENIFLNGAILGMRRKEIENKFDEIVAFSEVEKFIDTPVKHYSSGMYLRLAFAVAAHLEPEILLVDEVLAVGDVAFQKKCLGKMGDVAKHGRTVLFVSHNMSAVRTLCNAGLVMNNGQIAQRGDVGESIRTYYEAIGVFDNNNNNNGPSVVDGMPRSGFGRVSIQGIQGNTVLQSQPFVLTTTLRIDHTTSGFWLFCIMEDMHGRTVYHLREESSALGIKEVIGGDYTVAVELPALWLSPGLYSAYFKVIYWGEKGAPKHLSDKYPLDVEGTNSAVESVLHPRAAWTVAQPESELSLATV
jgi:lipopolysaccharide transport system ATP-binding protein